MAFELPTNIGTFPACLEACRIAQIACRRSVEDTVRPIQGFVPGVQPHQGPPRHRHVIDSVRMVCGTPDQYDWQIHWIFIE
jgi:hypothetical protein